MHYPCNNKLTNLILKLDIDDCALELHSCDVLIQHCVDTLESFTCSCKAGYDLFEGICHPDQCAFGDDNCHEFANCLNIIGGDFTCRCKEGFNGDGVDECVDIDVCLSDSPPMCNANEECIDGFGLEYECVCKLGFELDSTDDGTEGWQRLCVDINECLNSPCLGSSVCSNTVGSYECHSK